MYVNIFMCVCVCPSVFLSLDPYVLDRLLPRTQHGAAAPFEPLGSVTAVLAETGTAEL